MNDSLSFSASSCEYSMLEIFSFHFDFSSRCLIKSTNVGCCIFPPICALSWCFVAVFFLFRFWSATKSLGKERKLKTIHLFWGFVGFHNTRIFQIALNCLQAKNERWISCDFFIGAAKINEKIFHSFSKSG